MADDKSAGVEASAISILKRAVELDNSKRFDESMTCYQEGVGLLMQVLKCQSDLSHNAAHTHTYTNRHTHIIHIQTDTHT